MKKWIALVLVAAAVGGGLWLRGRYRAGSEIAEPYEAPDLTPDEIREGLRSDEIATRLDAVNQIDRLPEPARKAALLGALEEESSPTRLTAVTALAERFPGDPEVVGRLLGVAKDDPDADVRGAAFRALEKSGDPRALDLAFKTLDSTDAPLGVKLEAARMLDRLTGRTTAPTLKAKLDEAGAAADDLLMDWDEWLETRKGKLVWDAEQGRFVTGE